MKTGYKKAPRTLKRSDKYLLKMKRCIGTLLFFVSLTAYAQEYKLQHVKDTFNYNSYTVHHVDEDFETTKNAKCRIIINSEAGHVTVEIGKHKPRHYIIDTKGVTREMDIGIKKSFVFRLSPIYGMGDYMFVRFDWNFVVLMDEENHYIYIFKNLM